MASIDTGGGDSGHKKGPGVKKAKKLSTRVDMTPMVDLGFLLITFFVFTATMSTPTAMDLNMPKDDVNKDQEMDVKQSGALTLMLGKANNIYWYPGILEVSEEKNNFQQTTYKEVRKIILDKKAEVIANHRHNPEICTPIQESAKKKGDPDWQDACKDVDFMVIIKPDADATYKNTVDILDEMTINQVKRYAMVKITPVELELIKKTEESKGIK